MQQINVFISEADTPRGRPKVRVDQPIVGVHSGDSVLWEIHSAVDEVRWVEVEFEKNKKNRKRSEFFEDHRRNDPNPRHHVRYAEVKNGHGHLLGAAPRLGKPSSKQDKYWIRGYKLKDEPDPQKTPKPDPVCWLDPDIIVCDP